MAADQFLQHLIGVGAQRRGYPGPAAEAGLPGKAGQHARAMRLPEASIPQVRTVHEARRVSDHG